MERSTINSIAVFCGANTGNRPDYLQSAEQLAKALVAANLQLIYGGGNCGLMGALANEVLVQGGNVIGVMPEMLVGKEKAHGNLTQLHIVNTMTERKALISKLADAFIMLPGGVGTLDEFFEVFTWARLGIQRKPFGVLNTSNYYDHLLNFLEHTVTEGFVHHIDKNMMLADSDPIRLIQRLQECVLPVEVFL